MPIVGWHCSGCNADVSLDHFEHSACGLLVVHPDYAAAVLRDRADHEKKNSGPPEVTSGTSCPRKDAILHQENVYVDPALFNAMITGTAWHRLLHAAADPKLSEVKLRGLAGSWLVQGTVDRLRPSLRVLEDHKHHNDFSAKYNTPEKAAEKHAVQVGVYAALVKQQFGWIPEKAIVWDHYTGRYGGPVEVPIRPVEELLEIHPSGCEFTVSEFYWQATAWKVHGVTWRELPLAGESMIFGTARACDYCPAKDVCWKQAKGAAF